MTERSNAHANAGAEFNSLACSFAKVFAGRRDARGTLNGGCIKETVKIDHFINHLEGKESLGLYLLLDDGTCNCILRVYRPS